MSFSAIYAPTVRAADFRDAGGFDESLASAEDWDCWLSLARRGRKTDVRAARRAALPGPRGQQERPHAAQLPLRRARGAQAFAARRPPRVGRWRRRAVYRYFARIYPLPLLAQARATGRREALAAAALLRPKWFARYPSSLIGLLPLLLGKERTRPHDPPRVRLEKTRGDPVPALRDPPRAVAGPRGAGPRRGAAVAGRFFRKPRRFTSSAPSASSARTAFLNSSSREVVPIPRKIFVEFGVESYREANTRFLLVNDNWSGLVLDGDADNIQTIRDDPIYWYHNLKARAAFVTRDNIDALLVEGGRGRRHRPVQHRHRRRGLVGVGGNRVVAAGDRRGGIQPPFRGGRERDRAVPAGLRPAEGAPLLVLLRRVAAGAGTAGAAQGLRPCRLRQRGPQRLFVRSDLRPESLPVRSVEEAFVDGQFCEYHDADGDRRRIPLEEQRALVLSLPLVQVGDDGRAEGTA